MKKFFITGFDPEKYQPRDLFPLTRLLLQASLNESNPARKIFAEKVIADLELKAADSLEEADFVLVSEPLTHLSDRKKYLELARLNAFCSPKNVPIYALVGGDYGKVHPSFSHVIYYRMGGFKTQLNEKNRAFFPLLSDHLKGFFNRDEIILREKKELPTVGFCGHTSASTIKYVYEKLKLTQINAQRLFAGDYNFEPLFSSAFERHKILESLRHSPEIETNFLFREKYRAGAVTEEERYQTALEYFTNIIESDYILCLRGAGNFSVRLYETLLMGRIPVFINTDCLLPLEDEIDWKKHVVWVEWADRRKIAEKIVNFHRQMTDEEFKLIQKRNREIWKSRLNVSYYLKHLVKSENRKGI